MQRISLRLAVVGFRLRDKTIVGIDYFPTFRYTLIVPM